MVSRCVAEGSCCVKDQTNRTANLPRWRFGVLSCVGHECFLTQDSWKGNPWQPWTQNLYTYVGNNPVNYVDPTGHWAETALDVAGFAWDAYEFAENPSWAGAGWLLLDVAGMALPFVPSAGAIRHADDVVKATGAFLDGIKGGDDLGKIAGKEIAVTQKGLSLVEGHLEKFGDYGPNSAMVDRLRSAMEEGRTVSGADASFYLHEASEATMMNRGLGYPDAHQAALSKYDVSPYSVYHPEVIRAFPDEFNSNWSKFWGMTEF